MKPVNLILFLALKAGWLISLGQVSQAGRFEIALTDEADAGFSAVSAGESGLLLYRRLEGRKEDQLELIRLDTTLKETWRGFITVARNVSLLDAEARQNFFFLLFQNRERASSDFVIIAVNILDGKFGTYAVKNLIPFLAADFRLTNDAALIGGYFNYRPLILHYSFLTQKSRILPGFFNEPGELNQIRINGDGSIDVIVSANNFNRRKSLWIRNYSSQGELIKTTIIEPDENRKLIFGRSIRMGGGQQVVSGTYGRFKDFSRGIFVAAINEVGEYKINYYSFADLEHFFNYMRDNREQRVKNRIERKKIKGKKLKFNYRILVHEIIPYKDQVIMLGEAFYPSYTYPSPYQTGGAFVASAVNNPLVRGDRIFDGYRYTHAVVVGFDRQGNLLWDNSFEINDVKTFTLKQYVKLQATEGRLVLLYVLNHQIRSKVIKDGEILEGKTFDELKLKFLNDSVKDHENQTSHLEYWYNRWLFAYGVQHVKNLQNLSVESERKVFFVNKITYQ